MSTMNIRSTNYFSRLTSLWKAKRKNQELYRIVIQNSETYETRIVTPLLRYTQRYYDRFYYQFQDLLKLKAKYFVTLTFQLPDNYTPEEYENYMTTWRNSWKKSATWLRKYSSGIQYFRTFELTKKNALHVHIVFFSGSTSTMEDFAKYYHKHHGFIDLKRFEYQILSDGSAYSHTYKYWINDNSPNHWQMPKTGGINFLPAHEDGDGELSKQFLISNYVMKYQMKEPTDTHKAIFTKFKIRSYGLTRSLSKMKRKILSSGDWQKIDEFHQASDDQYLDYSMKKLEDLIVYLDSKNTDKKYMKKQKIHLKNACTCFPLRNTAPNRKGFVLMHHNSCLVEISPS